MRKRVMGDKKGISPVIATILLVLIAVAAISIIFIIFRSFIPKAVPDFCQNVDVSINTGETCFNDTREVMKVQVAKGGSDVPIVRLQFIFSYSEGEESNIQEVAFDPNSEGIFYFNMSDINDGEMPLGVSLAAIVSSDGGEEMCAAGEEVSIPEDVSCPIPMPNINSTGWFGCTDDAWCLAKFKKPQYKCVKFPFSKQGACCWNGFCGGPGPGPGPGPGTCQLGTCEAASTKQCGLIYQRTGGTCTPPGDCPDKGAKCDNINFDFYQENPSFNPTISGSGFGYYDSVHNWTLMFDGNSDTYAMTNESYPAGEVWIAYAKPINAIAAGTKLQIKEYPFGQDASGNLIAGIKNLSLAPCWDIRGTTDNNIVIWIHHDGGGISIKCQASGGRSDVTLDQFTTGPSTNHELRIYEEAMIWNVEVAPQSNACDTSTATCSYIIPGEINRTGTCDSANINACNYFDEDITRECNSSTQQKWTWKEGVCRNILGLTGTHCQQDTHISITTCPSNQQCSAGWCGGAIVQTCVDYDADSIPYDIAIPSNVSVFINNVLDFASLDECREGHSVAERFCLGNERSTNITNCYDKGYTAGCKNRACAYNCTSDSQCTALAPIEWNSCNSAGKLVHSTLSYPNCLPEGYCNSSTIVQTIDCPPEYMCPLGGDHCVPGVPSAGLCYQESANVTNQGAPFGNPDGNCGLNYGGNYSVNTGNGGSAGQNYFYINYIKPANVQGAIWRVRHGTLPAYNVQISASCLNTGNKLSLRFYSSTPTQIKSYGQCYDGTNWITITNITNNTDNHGGGLPNINNSLRWNDGNWSTGSLYYWPNYWYNEQDLDPTLGTSESYIFEEAMIWNVSGGVPPVSAGLCYQECVGKDAQTGINNCANQKANDGNCGQNYSGVYNDLWPSFNQSARDSIEDGNWGTSSSPSTTTYLYLRYNKPSQASSGAVWRVKDDVAERNITIPESCWNASSNLILLEIVMDPGNIIYLCEDTGATTIGSMHFAQISERPHFAPPPGGIKFYEEGIWWNLSGGGIQTCTVLGARRCTDGNIGGEYYDECISKNGHLEWQSGRCPVSLVMDPVTLQASDVQEVCDANGQCVVATFGECPNGFTPYTEGGVLTGCTKNRVTWALSNLAYNNGRPLPCPSGWRYPNSSEFRDMCLGYDRATDKLNFSFGNNLQAYIISATGYVCLISNNPAYPNECNCLISTTPDLLQMTQGVRARCVKSTGGGTEVICQKVADKIIFPGSRSDPACQRINDQNWESYVGLEAGACHVGDQSEEYKVDYKIPQDAARLGSYFKIKAGNGTGAQNFTYQIPEAAWNKTDGNLSLLFFIIPQDSHHNYNKTDIHYIVKNPGALIGGANMYDSAPLGGFNPPNNVDGEWISVPGEGYERIYEIMTCWNVTTSTGCKVAGEMVGSPGSGECCSGLQEVSTGIVMPSGLCSRPGTYICSDCGNGICESWENKCNCAQDCPGGTFSGVCYQEKTDRRTARDGGCELIYYIDSCYANSRVVGQTIIFPPECAGMYPQGTLSPAAIGENVWDGDWGTSGKFSANANYFKENYVRPRNVASAILTVGVKEGGSMKTYNFSIPNQCIIPDETSHRFNASYPLSVMTKSKTINRKMSLNISCLDLNSPITGTNEPSGKYIQFAVVPSEDRTVYEEGIYWTISAPSRGTLANVVSTVGDFFGNVWKGIQNIFS